MAGRLGEDIVIDKSGETVFKADGFRVLGDFHEGRSRIEVYPKFGFINKAGKMVINADYMGALDFSEGLAAVAVSVGKLE